jgi:hypothetical protein
VGRSEQCVVCRVSCVVCGGVQYSTEYSSGQGEWRLPIDMHVCKCREESEL